jgi:glycosyltransferase involved in cell wall biosynthesis
MLMHGEIKILNKKNTPLVSVHMPVFNTVKYIEAALDSVLCQTYENIEICIGDNASTDGTAEILKIYKEKYPEKIKLFFNKENVGFIKNCNMLLGLCSGEFISFHHADDIMFREKIEKQVNLMLDNPKISLCQHNLNIIDKNGKVVSNFFGHKKPRSGNLSSFIKNNISPPPTSMMARASEIPHNGYRESFGEWGDVSLWPDILEKGGDITYIYEMLGSYRIHESNISMSSDAEHLGRFLSREAFYISKYPKYYKEFKKNMSSRLRFCRHLNQGKDYAHYLLASNSMLFSSKCIFALSVYYSTFKKIKL